MILREVRQHPPELAATLPQAREISRGRGVPRSRAASRRPAIRASPLIIGGGIAAYKALDLIRRLQGARRCTCAAS